MYKTIYLLLLIPTYAICQSKYLGTHYKCQSAVNGKTQDLTLLKNDSFYYWVNGIMTLPGTYRVSLDSLILTSSKLPQGVPLIFRIKSRYKLVAYNGHRQEPEWYLTKVE